ncbi:hypothetical protein HGRIS_014129 [Hohenbuehelia grisea]|uniref:Glycoside hydrolase family 12 protein n=1 Tax=Hohenbuehelia grisea TaxID=104357 RepID=A0ABR3JUF0_9AGAR
MFKMFTKLSSVIALLPFVTAAPVLYARQSIDTSSHCGQWDTVEAGPYSLLLDQWGLEGATSGSQCASLTSLSGDTVAWTTKWSWTGGTGVKSFTNIQLNEGLDVQLGSISSIPAMWTWSQEASGSIVADIAYDLFTSDTIGGANVNEIMVWLANYNAGPISAVYNADGTPQPVASNVALAGHTWNVYFGSNGANNVYSFLPSSGGVVSSFSGDLNEFLKYLTSEQGVSTSQYLKTAQGGTEPTTGSATLTSSAFSLAIQ